MVTTPSRSLPHSIQSSTLADVLERILDKGLVIAGDIKIKLVDIELLTIQIRLVVASVDKAQEIGIDFWRDGSSSASNKHVDALTQSIEAMGNRLAAIEAGIAAHRHDRRSECATALIDYRAASHALERPSRITHHITPDDRPRPEADQPLIPLRPPL